MWSFQVEIALKLKSMIWLLDTVSLAAVLKKGTADGKNSCHAVIGHWAVAAPEGNQRVLTLISRGFFYCPHVPVYVTYALFFWGTTLSKFAKKNPLPSCYQCIKVSKSQNQYLVFLILPRNEKKRKNHPKSSQDVFFCFSLSFWKNWEFQKLLLRFTVL